MVRSFKASEIVKPYPRVEYENNPFESVDNFLLAPGQKMKGGIAVNTHTNQDVKNPSEFDLSLDWKPVNGRKWTSSTFRLDVESALDTHVLYAKSRHAPGEVSEEINRLTQTVEDVFRESTFNDL